MRLRALEELEAKDLFPETHPRLERHEGRTSIAQFKQNHVNIAKEDQQQAQEQQEEDEEPVARAPRTTLYGTPSRRLHAKVPSVLIMCKRPRQVASCPRTHPFRDHCQRGRDYPGHGQPAHPHAANHKGEVQAFLPPDRTW
jgi:hypothetical protein